MSYKKAIDKLTHKEKMPYMIYDNISDAIKDADKILNETKKSKCKKISNAEAIIETELDFKLMAIFDNLKNSYDNIDGEYSTFLQYMKKNIKCDVFLTSENEDDPDHDDFFYQ